MTKAIFETMKFTKENMINACRNNNIKSIQKEYHNFRVFSRYLFIRGGYGTQEMRAYCNNKMKALRDELEELVRIERGY